MVVVDQELIGRVEGAPEHFDYEPETDIVDIDFQRSQQQLLDILLDVLSVVVQMQQSIPQLVQNQHQRPILGERQDEALRPLVLDGVALDPGLQQRIVIGDQLLEVLLGLLVLSLLEVAHQVLPELFVLLVNRTLIGGLEPSG